MQQITPNLWINDGKIDEAVDFYCSLFEDSRVLTTSVEHHAILDSVHWLADAQGAEAVWLAPGTDGRIAPDALRAAIAQAAST